MRLPLRFRIVAVAIVTIVFTGCYNETTPPSSARSRQIVPEASEGIALSREGSSGLAIQGAEEAINPRVELPDEMLFISAQDANLDIDEPEEQIVVVKRRDDPEDRIRIVVADFDTLRNTYRITWEGKTLATNIRTFAVSSQDLIGDHVDEIVGVGTDRQGRQTMDVFRRQQDEATATGIAYERIFSVATDGSIEIASQQRSDSYRTLQSNGRSFPIDVYRQNRETETPLDLIMTRWTWNDPESREVVLFHEDRQERYEWMNSYKTLYAEGPGLWMNLRNDVLSTVRLQLSLTILGVDTMQLSVDGAEYWNGSYQRMTSGIQSGVLRRYNLNAPSFVLDGVYTNENDVELLFNRPFFHLRTPTIDWSGGYNLVEIGEPVLELKVVEYGEVPEGVRVREDGSFTVRYMIEYGEFEAEGGQIRRILLTPVRVTVDGLEPTSGPEYSLEQVPDSDT
ncbi:MAG: pallilysin-related adhesin [Alkalispirochaeta sp.]